MTRQWIANEHHRLHLIEHWPDGAPKVARLAAIRSAIRSLGPVEPEFECIACTARPPKHIALQHKRAA